MEEDLRNLINSIFGEDSPVTDDERKLINVEMFSGDEFITMISALSICEAVKLSFEQGIEAAQNARAACMIMAKLPPAIQKRVCDMIGISPIHFRQAALFATDAFIWSFEAVGPTLEDGPEFQAAFTESHDSMMKVRQEFLDATKNIA